MVDSFLQYIQYEKRCSPHTLTSYQTDLLQFTQFLDTVYECKTPEAAIFPMIRSWIVSLVEEKRTPTSVNRKIATLRTFFKFLLRRNIISHDPMLKVKALKVNKALPQFVDEQSLNQLLDTFEFTDDFAGTRDKLVMELLYGSGMRLAEMISLQESDVSTYEQTIKVTGKRNKQRIIPISKRLIDLINTYIQSKKNTFFNNHSSFLIVTDQGETIYPMMVYRIVRKYLDLATTVEKRSPHVLRHTFATHLLNKGADLNAIKDLLGHSSLAATQVYTHNSLEKLKTIFEQAHPKA
ncbi:tyrosine-type recombinase/integrase [Rhodocytophaga rosea]|uniref:Tyrosine recombinase XerC n=1 Tax=Rhodocytophaga rosea TaxID=2704465 RepID=A0A6C0GJT9_9BACT|nr:tyrosine-type recombinase/integrase [Rhodocytophaga rosea]QHT68298.1 tyrosine-type recombinase/integrase [Rhodocytophaga rosea]